MAPGGGWRRSPRGRVVVTWLPTAGGAQRCQAAAPWRGRPSGEPCPGESLVGWGAERGDGFGHPDPCLGQGMVHGEGEAWTASPATCRGFCSVLWVGEAMGLWLGGNSGVCLHLPAG